MTISTGTQSYAGWFVPIVAFQIPHFSSYHPEISFLVFIEEEAREYNMFYGWYIVIAGAILDAFVVGIAWYGFTAMFNPIATKFGWSYAQVSLAITLRGAGCGMLNPAIGAIVDRFSIRNTVFLGITVTGLGLLTLGRVSSLLMFYITFISFSLGVTFCTLLVPMAAVMKCFKKNVGKAASVLSFGVALGGLTIPLITVLIDSFGLKAALTILAIAVWGVGIPLSFVFGMGNEDQNESSFHGQKGKKQPKVHPLSQSPGLSIREAVMTRPFWHIGLAFMLQIAALDAVMFHVMPYLKSVGIERTFASTIAMAIPLVSIPSRFGFGWLSDIYKRHYVIAAALTFTGLGMFLFAVIKPDVLWLISLFVIVFGIGLGGYTPLMSPIVKEYYGARNFGVILGSMNVLLTIGGISTPLIAGIVYDRLGYYGPLWNILGAVSILGAVIIITIPPKNMHGMEVPV